MSARRLLDAELEESGVRLDELIDDADWINRRVERRLDADRDVLAGPLPSGLTLVVQTDAALMPPVDLTEGGEPR